jgi:hypothetical protein
MPRESGTNYNDNSGGSIGRGSVGRSGRSVGRLVAGRSVGWSVGWSIGRLLVGWTRSVAVGRTVGRSTVGRSTVGLGRSVGLSVGRSVDRAGERDGRALQLGCGELAGCVSPMRRDAVKL